MEPKHEEEGSRYTPREELYNRLTHGLGLVLSVAALSVLVSMAAVRGSAWHVISFSVYGASLVILYLSSTLYHSFGSPKVKKTLRKMDHISIYFLIAGTYTPFMLLAVRGVWGWSLFGVVWGLALVGTVLKLFFAGRFEVLSMLLYVVMGWLVVIALKPVLAGLSTEGFFWLLAGGLFYTSGLFFYICQRIPYNHAVWHLFVLAGSICHFFSVLLHLMPVRGAVM